MGHSAEIDKMDTMLQLMLLTRTFQQIHVGQAPDQTPGYSESRLGPHCCIDPVHGTLFKWVIRSECYN